MAQFSLSLRKKFALTPLSSMDRASDTSGDPGLANPLASLEDVPRQDSDSSSTASHFGQIKSKRFLSFRPNNRRRLGLFVDQLADSGRARSSGSLRLHGGTELTRVHKSSSESKAVKMPSFATLFLRRSTPSWRNNRGLRIDSGAVADPSAFSDMAISEFEPSSLAFYPIATHNLGDKRPIGKPDLLDHWHQGRSPLVENLAGGTDVLQSTNLSATDFEIDSEDEPVSSGSDSDSPTPRSDEIGSWSTLPVPPIIISAPTPPDALCFADENSSREPHLRLVDSEQKAPSAVENLEERTTDFRQVPMAIRTLQSAAHKLESDPSVTQKNIFRLSAPITAFLYTLGVGVIMLKKEAVIFGPEPGVKKALQIAVHITLLMPGMLLVLVLLRGIIWVVSKLGRSFCELDLEEVFTRGISVDSEGERLTEADFIMGNLLT